MNDHQADAAAVMQLMIDDLGPDDMLDKVTAPRSTGFRDEMERYIALEDGRHYRVRIERVADYEVDVPWMGEEQEENGSDHTQAQAPADTG